MNDDFSALEKMAYSGRGVLVGRLDDEGEPEKHVVGYTLSGRSASSKARKLVYDKGPGVVRILVTDYKQLEEGNPALLVYPAITTVWDNAGAEKRRLLGLLASNGSQTELLYESALMSLDTAAPMTDIRTILSDSLAVPSYRYASKDGSWIDITKAEPDAPNCTPRILGGIWGMNGLVTYGLGIVRQGENPGFFEYELRRGEGRMITTYKGGNEAPLEPYRGRPFAVRLKSTKAEDIARNMFEAIRGHVPGKDCAVAACAMVYDEGKGELDVAIEPK